VPSSPSLSVRAENVSVPDTIQPTADPTSALAATTSLKRTNVSQPREADPRRQNPAEISALSADVTRSSRTVRSTRAEASQAIEWSAPTVASSRTSPSRRLSTDRSASVAQQNAIQQAEPLPDDLAELVSASDQRAARSRQTPNAEPVAPQANRAAEGVTATDGLVEEADEAVPMPLNRLARRETPRPRPQEPVANVIERTNRSRQPIQIGTESRILIPTINEGTPSAREPTVEPLDSFVQKSSAQRRFEDDVLVNLPEELGAGGLQNDADPDVGVDLPLATPLSSTLQPRSARFVRQNVGRPLTTRVTVDMAAEAFRRRLRRGQAKQDGEGRPPPKTEEAIERGLAFIMQLQREDGRWTLDNSDLAGNFRATRLHSDAAATGLSLLAFLGAGYHHLDDRYQDPVRQGLKYLVEAQQPDGNLYVPGHERSDNAVAFYSHGIATLALCEAYGMTNDETLREPAQQALDYIRDTQRTELGGWRYNANRRESDTSVSGWMMMALKSGELAELNVSQQTHQRIVKWLDTAQAAPDQPHLYRYNPLAPNTPRQRHGRQVTPVMTSVGLLMRMYSGWRRDHPSMIRGADYLAETLPSLGTSERPTRDTYYWYYATQVMFHMGGDHWKAWNDRLHPMLVDSQRTTGEAVGSWDPFEPVVDRWAVHAGRLYVTTMNLLSLEVYYRHLPLFDDTAR